MDLANKLANKLTEKHEKAIDYQIELQEQLQANGFNIVNCCHCGNVLIHKSVALSEDEEEESIVCNNCLYEVYPNDCGDLYYSGMPVATVDDFDDFKILNKYLRKFLKSVTEIEDLDYSRGIVNQKWKYYIWFNGDKFEYDCEVNRNNDYEIIKMLF